MVDAAVVDEQEREIFRLGEEITSLRQGLAEARTQQNRVVSATDFSSIVDEFRADLAKLAKTVPVAVTTTLGGDDLRPVRPVRPKKPSAS